MAVPMRKEEYEQSAKHQGSSVGGKQTTVDQSKYSKAANEASFAQQRRTTADRTELAQKQYVKNSTRNVQTEWHGGPTVRKEVRKKIKQAEKAFATHKSTDQLQRESYAKQGLQPSSIDDKAVPQKQYQPIKQIDRSARTEHKAAPTQPKPKPVSIRTKLRRKRYADKSKHKGLARLRASAANAIIVPVGIFFWLFFQMPFAIFNVIFFGLTAAIGFLTQAVQVEEDDWWITRLFKAGAQKVAELAGEAIGWLSSLIGFDLSVLNPGNLWMVTEFIILGFVFFFLLSMYLIYKMFLLNPLSTGGKIIILALVLVGYMIPFLNFVPWFLVWAFAVWLRPK